jgi:TRAP-type C4-dicarboxylate transport system substrate-binding protein
MIRKAVLGAAVVVALAVPAAAEPVVLKLNSAAPPRAYPNTDIFQPWADAVTEASGGTLKVQTFFGGTLAIFPVTYDRVIDGVADIGFILTQFAAGKLKQQEVAGLPFESKSAIEATHALWKIFEKGVTAKEFSDVKVLALWSFNNTALHSKDRINTLDDIKGMKIIASNATAARMVSALGGTPVTFRVDESYQAISRGTAEGVIMSFTGMAVFKINEVTKHHLDTELGSDVGVLFMNKQRYDALPPQAKAAIDKFSYLALSEKAGNRVDVEWVKTRDMVKDSVYTLPPDQARQWRKAVDPVAAEWAKNTPDGAKVLEAYRAEINAYRAQKK